MHSYQLLSYWLEVVCWLHYLFSCASNKESFYRVLFSSSYLKVYYLNLSHLCFYLDYYDSFYHDHDFEMMMKCSLKDYSRWYLLLYYLPLSCCLLLILLLMNCFLSSLDGDHLMNEVPIELLNYCFLIAVNMVVMNMPS